MGGVSLKPNHPCAAAAGLSYSNITYTYNDAALPVLPASAAHALIATDAKHQGVFVPRSTQLPALVSVNVTVTNNGPYAAADSVLCFLTPPGAGTNGNPIQSLVGFTRIFLNVGESQTVFFPLTARDITLIDQAGHRVAAEGRYELHIGVGPNRITREFLVQ